MWEVGIICLETSGQDLKLKNELVKISFLIHLRPCKIRKLVSVDQEMHSTSKTQSEPSLCCVGLSLDSNNLRLINVYNRRNEYTIELGKC
mgnify:CR=1 FL=1